MSASGKTFSDFKLNKQLFNAIEELGYKIPTPIQAKAISLALAGHDIIGIAPTGTGKTAAYAIPLIMKAKYSQKDSPRILVMAPTKELVIQIQNNFKELSKYTDLRTLALFGGIGPTQQIDSLKEGVDILVSTPGRFLDLYSRECIPTRFIKIMVLDEADKMMDMGFMPQIRKILEVIPVKRQNLLFSATMPQKVVELSHEFLDFPQVVEVAPQATTAQTIEQELYFLPNFKTKIYFLESLLSDQRMSRVIVFVKTRRNADNIFKFLSRKIPDQTRVIHANKGQNSRINAINEFREGNIRVLVSTDVAARGIDISDVTHVINFDVPVNYEEYVHRIGRTGRAEKSGTSITFVNDSEKYHIKKIEELIKQKIPIQDLPADVEVFDTPFEESQEMAREIDRQRKLEDPEFHGAFHSKKRSDSDSGGVGIREKNKGKSGKSGRSGRSGRTRKRN